MKRLARLKIAMADLAKRPSVVHLPWGAPAKQKAQAPWQPAADTQKVVLSLGPFAQRQRVQLLRTPDALRHLIESGFTLTCAEALAGSIVTVLRRDPFFVLIEHENSRYAVPYTVLPT